MPTTNGDLTKSELLSAQIRTRTDSTFLYVEAVATVDGYDLQAEVTRRRKGRTSVPMDVPVGAVAETLQAEYEKAVEQDTDEEASAL